MEGELQLNLRQIIQALERILDRPSRWNGNLALERELFYSGMPIMTAASVSAN